MKQFEGALPGIDRRTKAEKIAAFLAGAALLMALACFLIVWILSVSGTAMLDPDKYYSEHVLFLKDSVLLNLAAIAAALALAALIRRFCGRTLQKIGFVPAVVGLLLFVLAFGAAYIISVKPELSADARLCVYAGEDLARGKFEFLEFETGYYKQYFWRYPFQLGLVAYYAILSKIVGCGHMVAYGLVNVCLLALGYAAILYTVSLTTENKRMRLLTVLLMALFVQPIFYCGLLYGPVPSFALAAVGAAFLTRYIRKGNHLIDALLASLLIGLAAIIKINALIYAIAAGIVLVLDAIGRKKFLPLVYAALTVALASSLPGLAAKAVQGYAGKTFAGEAVPSVNWVLIGLGESDRAPGWYFNQPYDYADPDRAAVEAKMKADLALRIEEFRENPAYAADFFAKKLRSTWDEPTFQSVWVTRIKKLQETVGEPANTIYSSSLGGPLFTYFRYGTVVLYALFLLGLADRIFSKEARAEALPLRLAGLIFPLILMGAFLYHLVSETKSEYVLLYIPLLLPTAARGLDAAAERLAGRIGARGRGSD